MANPENRMDALAVNLPARAATAKARGNANLAWECIDALLMLTEKGYCITQLSAEAAGSVAPAPVEQAKPAGKRITLRYPSKCSSCGEQIAGGSEALFVDGKFRHVECGR